MSSLAELVVNRGLLMQTGLVFVLTLSRVGGLVATAPVFGSQEVPLRIRALLAVAMALLVMPLVWTSPVANPGNVLNLLVLVGGEIVIGALLGLGVLIVFSGVQVAGQLISQLSGMSLADIFNPGFDENIPIISQLLFYVAVAVFVLIGGHRQLIAALLDTLATIPLGGGIRPEPIADVLTTLVSQSFLLGVRAAAPAMTALLLATLVIALVSRTLPQMNIMSFGFGLNSLVTFGVLALSLGSIAWLFQDQVETTIAAVVDALGDR